MSQTKQKSARARKSSARKAPTFALGAASADVSARVLLWSRPGFLIRRLLQIHNGLYFEECSDWNITPVQYGILTILSGEPEGLDIRSLAADLGVDRSNTADVARRLIGRGYITQNLAPSDRRMVISRITQTGRDLLDEAAPAMQRSQMKLLAPLDARTRETVLNAITKLVTVYNDKGRAKLRL